MTWNFPRGSAGRESDPGSQESAPLSCLIPALRRGAGRGWVTGGAERGRCRMSSCEGAGTFWAGKKR